MLTLYCAMERELLVVSGQHPTWHVERRLLGLQTTCVAVDPFETRRVYCGTFGRGVWRSEDAGETWLPVGDAGAAMRQYHGGGIEQPKVTSVAVSPTERVGTFGVVYVGTEPSSVYRSDDGGDTWRDLASLRALPSAPTWSFPPRPYTSHARWIEPDPDDAGRVYVALEAGALVRTLDDGQTWEDKQPGGPFDTHTIAMSARLPGALFISAGDGYFESEDGGTTWRRPNQGLTYRYLWGIAVDVDGATTVLASASPSPGHAHQPAMARSGIFRRSNDSAWQQVSKGLPADEGLVIPILASHPAEPGVFYTLTNHGVFRSTDVGESWEKLAIPWDPAFVNQHQQAIAIAD
jgi:photosystem II stability/assembly factor-like uncharacterized protein